MGTSLMPGSLAEIQQFVQSALLQTNSDVDANSVRHYIAPSLHLSAVQRLAIYQHSYYARLLQCLQRQFKTLNHALGAALFADFAREYLREVPSSSPTLSDLGNHFTAFLQRNRPDAKQPQKEIWIEFMIELADFEWMLYGLFDAPGIEEDGYANEDNMDDSFLDLQPCLCLRQYRFPVNEYYRHVANGKDPEFPVEQQTYLALVRKNYQIGIFVLLPAQHYFLQQLSCLQSPQTINQALANTAEVFERDIESVKGFWHKWKRDWLNAGFFCKRK